MSISLRVVHNNKDFTLKRAKFVAFNPSLSAEAVQAKFWKRLNKSNNVKRFLQNLVLISACRMKIGEDDQQENFIEIEMKNKDSAKADDET